MAKSFGKKLSFIIREDVTLSESSSYGQPIFDYQPQSPGAEDYWRLSEKILESKITTLHVEIA